MFFAAGRAVKKYNSHSIRDIRGMITAMPFAGAMLITGAFALTGTPPFSAFFSEIMIIMSGFTGGFILQSALLLLFMAVVFCAMIHNISRSVFGEKPEGMAREGEPLSGKLAFGILLFIICAAGVAAPGFFRDLLTAASEIIRGA
jgi:hydrogenase-4 component F